MNKIIYVLLFFSHLVFVFSYKTTINLLYDTILAQQIQKSTPYIPGPTLVPPLSEEKYKGIFPSYIHFNFIGNPIEQALRHNIKFFDNNFFVTVWCLNALTEAAYYEIIELNETSTSMALDVLVNNFKDHNIHESLIPAMSFWKQRFFNNSYFAWPTNIANPLNLSLVIEGIVNAWVNKYFPQFLPLIHKLESLLPGSELLTAFSIPSDFDDSSVNLALGYFLKLISPNYPSLYNLWSSDPSNTNIDGYFRYIKKYAYRPFEQNVDQNSIDPRSYYWLRHFLEEIQDEMRRKSDRQSDDSNGNHHNDDNRSDNENNKNSNRSVPSLILITTWLQNITIDKENYGKRYDMPFNDNNIDPTVVSNSLYAITVSVLSTLNDSKVLPVWFDTEAQQIYTDCVQMLSWLIGSEFILTRTDITLLYYPSVMDFYWFVGRSLFALESTDLSHPNYSILLQAYETLSSAMRTNGTQQLLKLSKTISNGEFIVWDEFLGNADTDFSNKGTPHYDDRIFSTAVASLALIEIWSKNVNGKLTWINETPITIKQTLSASTSFLNTYILPSIYHFHQHDATNGDWEQNIRTEMEREDDETMKRNVRKLNKEKTEEETEEGNVNGMYGYVDDIGGEENTYYRLDNAFFSGSVKGVTSLPFFYPANSYNYMNGTVLKPSQCSFSTIQTSLIVTMSGTVTEEEYDDMILSKPCNETTPSVFRGFNEDGKRFVFWSSDILTQSFTLLALGKYNLLQNN